MQTSTAGERRRRPRRSGRSSRADRAAPPRHPASTFGELPLVEIAERDVAGRAERLHLAGEDLLVAVVVGDRGHGGGVVGQRDRRQRAPLEQEAADELGGDVRARPRRCRRCRTAAACRRSRRRRRSARPAATDGRDACRVEQPLDAAALSAMRVGARVVARSSSRHRPSRSAARSARRRTRRRSRPARSAARRPCASVVAAVEQHVAAAARAGDLAAERARRSRRVVELVDAALEIRGDIRFLACQASSSSSPKSRSRPRSSAFFISTASSFCVRSPSTRPRRRSRRSARSGPR